MRLIRKELEAGGRATHFIDLEDMRFLNLLDEGPEALLAYLEEAGLLGPEKLHLLIDEIQYLRRPSSFLKQLRDHHAERLKLIVSGSSSFEIKSKFADSLSGRTIDFIVPQEGTLLPVEVKKTAKRLRLTALRYFKGRYKVKRALCPALEGAGKPHDLYDTRYPWEGLS